jgi:nicotinamidase-related amidase
VVVVADTMTAGRTETREGICPPPQDVHALTLATLEQIGATVTSVRGVITGSYEPLVSEYLAALYTDAVGEADFVEARPLPTPSLHPTAAALVVVNVREEYPAPEYGYRNNNDAERHVERLVDAWRARDRPVVHTIHPPAVLPDDAVLQGSAVRPTSAEPVIEAVNADAFVRTELDDILQSNGVEQLVFVGLPFQESVASSARTALERGYEVLIVEDATAGYDFVADDGLVVAGTEAHWTEATSLAALGASLTATEELCEQLDT